MFIVGGRQIFSDIFVCSRYTCLASLGEVRANKAAVTQPGLPDCTGKYADLRWAFRAESDSAALKANKTEGVKGHVTAGEAETQTRQS